MNKVRKYRHRNIDVNYSQTFIEEKADDISNDDLKNEPDFCDGSKTKEKKKIPFILYSFISISLMLLLSEYIFKIIQFGFSFDISLVRITLFSLGFAGFAACLLSLLPIKISRFINTFFCFLIPIYALFQIGIHNMMHSYTTIKTAGGMAGALAGYIGQYIKQMPILYWLILLIPICYLVVSKKLDIYKSKNIKNIIVLLVCAICFDETGLLLEMIDGDWSQYVYPTYQETAIREYGIERFLLRDIATIFSEKEATIAQEENNEVVSTRKIDDTKWNEISESDDNEDRKTIDNYLMNRTIDGYNDKTGLLEGKNLIYIMIEAFDYVALDEELTPTLWKMKEDGWDFSNHYTPKFDTGTSDSELIAETSLVPRMDMGVYAEFSTNDWSDSIFSIFNAQGYSTHAYHNWDDQYYPRTEMMESMHCEDYEDLTSLPIEIISGWQSDYELIKTTVNKYVNEDKFMTMYITSSMHFPYDRDDELSIKHLEEIEEVHPDYPEELKRYLSKAMDLDEGLKYLISTLRRKGKLDDTAIVLFADHHPLNIDFEYIEEYTTEVDRSEGMNEFRSPLIIYCPSLLGTETYSGVSSTYNILPTILNLYDMDYDPRLYLGTDYFSDSESIVYFPDGDWLTDKGYYIASTDKFIETSEEKVGQSYIQKNTTKTNNSVNISYLIYTTDYFHYRSEITTPNIDRSNYEIVVSPDAQISSGVNEDDTFDYQ